MQAFDEAGNEHDMDKIVEGTEIKNILLHVSIINQLIYK